MHKKYTKDQKKNIADWINVQINAVGLDKDKIAEGARINRTTLDNYLYGKSSPADKVIDDVIEQVDKGKLYFTDNKKTGSHFSPCLSGYHHMSSYDFADFITDYKESVDYLYNQTDFSVRTGIAQPSLSKKLSRKTDISLEDQISILDFLFEINKHMNGIRTNLTPDRLTYFVRISQLYELSDIIMRNYRYLNPGMQERLEKIIHSILTVYASNIEPFDVIQKRFRTEPKKGGSTKISDTVRYINGIKSCEETWTANEDLKQYCLSIRTQSLVADGNYNKDLIKLLIFAVCASAKGKISLFRDDINFAALMAVCASELLDTGKMSEELYMVLDDLESRLQISFEPLRRKKISYWKKIYDFKTQREEITRRADELWYNRDDVKTVLSYFSNTYIMTESEREDFEKDLEILSEFTEEEMQMGIEESEDFDVQMDDTLNFFDSLQKGQRKLIIDNLPGFMGYNSIYRFEYLYKYLEKCKALDKEKLDIMIGYLSSYPQSCPFFGCYSPVNLLDHYIYKIDDEYTELTCCRNMMDICSCEDHESIPDKSVNENVDKKNKKLNVDKKNKKLFEKIVSDYLENYPGGDISRMLECKLKFSSFDWYLWQLILNAYYQSELGELKELLSGIESGELTLDNDEDN